MTKTSTPKVLELEEITEIVAAELGIKTAEDYHGSFFQYTSGGLLKGFYSTGHVMGIESFAQISVVPESEFDLREPGVPMVIQVKIPDEELIISVKVDRGISRADLNRPARYLKNFISDRITKSVL